MSTLMYNEHQVSILVAFWGKTKHFIGQEGELKWRILVAKWKRNEQKPNRSLHAGENARVTGKERKNPAMNQS